jgi:hypothetical protein
MTKENGKVTVGITVPALGQITGSMSLADIMGGAAPQEKDEVAVEIKPLKK